MSSLGPSSWKSRFSCHKREGCQLVKQALECEENDNGSDYDPNLVVTMYRMGVQELDKALHLLSRHHPDDDDPVKNAAMRVEIQKSRRNASERIRHLRAKIEASQQNKASGGYVTTRPAPPSTPEKKEANGGLEKWQNSLRSPRTPGQSWRSGKVKPPDVPNTEMRVGESSGKLQNNDSNNFEDYLCSTIVKRRDLGFNDVIGHMKAKQSLRESVILPSVRPELFSGLRTPSRGLLLFGPPGNGKTLLARALATECPASTLFALTASVLTSKYVGEGEKIVKSLFDLARKKAPSIIFIDEIDSIVSSRKSSEHEASRRLKNEFFSSFDGLDSSDRDRILVVGATNRPQELDTAAIRRFTKRIYIEMPDKADRKLLISNLLSSHGNPLTASEIDQVAKATVGYSNSDLANLARDAAFGPIRDIPTNKVMSVSKDDLRMISLEDFRAAVTRVRVSVTPESLKAYEEWNTRFGDVS